MTIGLATMWAAMEAITIAGRICKDFGKRVHAEPWPWIAVAAGVGCAVWGVML